MKDDCQNQAQLCKSILKIDSDQLTPSSALGPQSKGSSDNKKTILPNIHTQKQQATGKLSSMSSFSAKVNSAKNQKVCSPIYAPKLEAGSLDLGQFSISLRDYDLFQYPISNE